MKIKDYNYTITEKGEVYSLKTNKVIKPQNSWQGYLRVNLYKNGKSKYFQLHRLVAEYFISNPENKPEVNHKNFDKKDCRKDNLEWVTKLENMQHAKAVIAHPFGEKARNTKLSDVAVEEIKAKRHFKRSDLALEYKVSVRQILRILNNKNYREQRAKINDLS